MYALFIYNPMMNSTTFASRHSSKEVLIEYAHKKFHDNIQFAIYKYRDMTSLFGLMLEFSRWDLDTKFNGKNVESHYTRFTPAECAFSHQPILSDPTVHTTWFFKTF